MIFKFMYISLKMLKRIYERVNGCKMDDNLQKQYTELKDELKKNLPGIEKYEIKVLQ